MFLEYKPGDYVINPTINNNKITVNFENVGK